MPAYDYTCVQCRATEERSVLYAERHQQTCTRCGSPMAKQFPIEAARNFTVYETYHDEGLGIDITGPLQKKEALKALGLMETGDPVKGARNWDRKAPQHLDRTAPTGRTLADVQRDKEYQQKVSDAFEVQTVRGGLAGPTMRAKDLPNG